MSERPEGFDKTVREQYPELNPEAFTVVREPVLIDENGEVIEVREPNPMPQELIDEISEAVQPDDYDPSGERDIGL